MMCAEFKKRRDVMVAGLNNIKRILLPLTQRRVLRFPQHQGRPAGHRKN